MRITSLINTGPWLTMIAPAWFVYDSLVASYGVIIPVAVVIATGVELTGVAAYHTAIRLYTYNRKLRRKTDPRAPVGIAVAAVIAYILVGGTLTAVIKQDVSLSLFFLLSGAGYLTIALNINQDALETPESRPEIAPRKSGGKTPRAPVIPVEVPAEIPPKKPEFDERLTTLDGLEFVNAETVMARTGLGQSQAYEHIKHWRQTGALVPAGRGKYRLNGH